MKRYLFTILAVAAVSASCTKFVEDKEFEFQETASPKVTATTVSDTEINVTVTPEEGTTYYSYVVSEGAAQQLDATSLLQCKYESAAITVEDKKVSGILLSSEVKSLSLNLKELKPYTTYTVYAVAVNSQGVVSEVATASALTTDGTAPDFVKAEHAEKDSLMLFSILFDDPVVATGEGTVTAKFCARYGGTETNGLFKVLSSAQVPAGNVYNDASGRLNILIPKELYIPGAFVCLDWTAEVAENALGAKVPAMTSGAGLSQGQVASIGVVARYGNVPFDLALTATDENDGFGSGDEENEPEIFNDWEELMMIAFARTEHPLYSFTNTADIKIISRTPNGRTVTYSASSYGVLKEGNRVAVMLDEDPGFGSTVSYSISSGSVVDIYGNTSNELVVEDGYFCSYGYEISDVAGKYTFSSTSGYANYGYGPYENILTIAESDDEKEGNIMFTGQLADIDVKFYAELDKDSGIITLPGNPIVGTVVDYVYGDDGNPVSDGEGGYKEKEYQVMLALTNGQSIYSEQIGFDVPAAHTLSFWYAGQAFIGLIEVDGQDLVGFYDLLNLKSVTYTPDASQAASVSRVRAKASKPFVSLSR